MPQYTLIGRLQPPLGNIWSDTLTLTWDDGTLMTTNPDATVAIQVAAEVDVEVELPLPAQASPPYLADHAASLAWLRTHVLVRGHDAYGDLEDLGLVQPPDVLTGPVRQRVRFVA